MKDFPVFTTEYGVASLFLKEVPYKGIAYVVIRDSQDPEKLLEECAGFCRACGAEKIYATGHEALEKYPPHTTVCQMRCEAWVDEGKLESLFPVTEETVGRWRQICNERMAQVDNSATQEAKDENEILESGGAYFVHHEGELLGIGWIREEELLAVASVQPGAGERVMHTLMSLLPGETMTLEVVSTNRRAIRLYEKLGFVKTKEISRWYQI